MDVDSGMATGTEVSSTSLESDQSDDLNLCNIVRCQPGSTHQQNLSPHNTNSYDQGLSVPKNISQGKVEKFQCKQCDFSSITKLEYWDHKKTHIEAGKALSCPNCPFVTEHKYHMKYHLDNHAGLKPFKCSQCSYSGVSQSLLNSHMKSHSNISYRCASCSFASSYCHLLKLHLREYNHSPAMVLNPDGTPNPSLFGDVYSTRRGPKIKNPTQRPALPNINVLPVAPFPCNQLLPNAANMPIPFTGFRPSPGLLNGRSMISPESNVLNGSPPNSEAPNTNDFAGDDGDEEDTTIFDNVEVVYNRPREESDGTEHRAENLKLNLPMNKHSSACGSAMFLDQDGTPNPLPIVDVNGTRRGPEINNPEHRPTANLQYGPSLNSEMNGNCVLDLSKREAPNRDDSPKSGETKNRADTTESSRQLYCRFCDIFMEESIGHTIHMHYHDENHPYKCKICGTHCVNKLSFFEHILLTPHFDYFRTFFDDSPKSGETKNRADTTESSRQLYCRFCDIFMEESIGHTIHMHYHDENHPFRCKICGQQCNNKLSFFEHILRTPHFDYFRTFFHSS